MGLAGFLFQAAWQKPGSSQAAARHNPGGCQAAARRQPGSRQAESRSSRQSCALSSQQAILQEALWKGAGFLAARHLKNYAQAPGHRAKRIQHPYASLIVLVLRVYEYQEYLDIDLFCCWCALFSGLLENCH